MSEEEIYKNLAAKYYAAKEHFEELYRIVTVEAKGYWQCLENKEKEIDTLTRHRDKLLAACKALVEDGEYLEQDEGITACQCLAKAPDDIVEPPKCGYCLAKSAIEGK